MKNHIIRLFSVALAVCGAASAQSYTNYIRQTQMPAGVTWDASSAVLNSGTQFSDLAINPGGARFDLWTILNEAPPVESLLDTRYVSTYIPEAEVEITSDDPYPTIPRTRADRPFYVTVTVRGLRNGETDPEPSKSVSLLRHVQSYGAKGTGVGIDRSQAILLNESAIESNVEDLPLDDTELTQIPGADRAKIRGEERVSIYSLEDYQAPASQLASKFIQIWPVADGNIAGIAEGQMIRYKCPDLTITTNDLYPDSCTKIQFYSGPKRSMSDPQRQVTGFMEYLGWSKNHPNGALPPPDAVELLRDYDRSFETDGLWTIELVTVTPFGMDRLHAITFELDRTIEMNGTFTTIE